MQAKSFPDLITFTRATTGSYIEKATGLVKQAPINAPRFEDQGLLFETQRTNQCLNSEVLSVGTGITVSANVVTAPDGALTADIAVENTAASAEHYTADFNFVPAIGTTYTWSTFARRASGTRNLYIRVAGGSVAAAIFNFDTKTFQAPGGANYVTSGFKELVSGWFRVWIVFTATSATTAVCRTQIASGVNPVYTGDGTSGLSIWGRQLEVGDWQSSYMATTSSQVTRAADAAFAPASDWLKVGEGTLLVEAAPMSLGVRYSANLGISSSPNGRVGTYYHTTRQASGVVSDDAGAISFLVNNLGPVLTPGAVAKQALAYKINDFQYATAGQVSPVDTSGDLPTISRLTLGARALSTDQMHGHIRRIQYFPYRLTAAELQALTT